MWMPRDSRLAANLAINPARIVLCDEDHFLHRPTVVPLG